MSRIIALADYRASRSTRAERLLLLAARLLAAGLVAFSIAEMEGWV